MNYKKVGLSIYETCKSMMLDSDEGNFATTHMEHHTNENEFDVQKLTTELANFDDVIQIEINAHGDGDVTLVFARTLEDVQSHVRLFNSVREDIIEDDEAEPQLKKRIAEVLDDTSKYEVVFLTTTVGYGGMVDGFLEALEEHCLGESERYHEYFDDVIEFFEESQALVIVADNGNMANNNINNNGEHFSKVVFDVAIYKRKQSS